MHKFGWLQDAPDSRDRNITQLLSATYAALPQMKGYIAERVNLQDALPTPLDQGPTSACVGKSIKGAIATRRKLLGMNNPKIPREQWERLPSSRWPYWGGRTTHNAETLDGGTHIRGACRAMAFLGVCPEDIMPFIPEEINTPPSWNAFRAAYDQRWVQGYYRVLTSGEERIKEMKQALTAGFPIVFGMQVDSSWIGYNSGVIERSDTSKIIGGHATFLYGYQDGVFLGQNSWGAGWGLAGRYQLREAALTDSHVADITVIETPPFDTGTR